MIAHIKGSLVSQNPSAVVLDVGGVGLRVQIPLSSYDPSRKPGDNVLLLTHLHVREDALTLYGFASENERSAFQMLIGVSGIGPPMAQRILSGVAMDDFLRMVAAEDVKGLTRIKGVGPKLAQRLVFELKDRVASLPAGAAGATMPVSQGPLSDATAALVGLGADPAKVRQILVDIHAAEGEDVPIEKLIKEALRRI